MSSSSSDDEELRDKFKEAVSEELINHMKEDGESKKSGKVAMVNVKSKRNDSGVNEDLQFEMKCTPEFRMHVAKKLTTFLDRILDTNHMQATVPTKETDASHGIRLLKRSANLLQLSDESSTKSEKRLRRPMRDSSSDEEDTERFSSVCVSGTSILKGGEGAFKKKTTESLVNNTKET